jgi:hypothetical protein
LALALQACRKEAHDTTPPLIHFSSPTAGQTFYFQDNIPIEALVSDETQLTSVTVDIMNSSDVRVLDSHEFHPDNKQLQIDLSISHTDLYLPSGTYHVKIKASDGENDSYAFQEIQLIEAPRTLDQIFIVRPGAGTASIDSLHGSTLLPWFNFSGNYAFGGIDSRNNQLVASSTDASELVSFTYPDLEPLPSTLPNIQNEITAFYHDNNQHQFIWGNNVGQVFITDQLGSRLFSYIYASGRIKCITATNQHIIVISQASSGNTNYIDVYPRSIGIPSLTLQVAWEITGAIPLKSDWHFFVLGGNNNNQGYFAYLNLNTGAINENFNFYDQSTVSSMIAADGDDFYAIQSNGIVRYINNFSSFSFNDALHPNKLIYDDLNQALWAIDAAGVHQFNESLTNETAFIPLIGATDLWLKFNK